MVEADVLTVDFTALSQRLGGRSASSATCPTTSPAPSPSHLLAHSEVIVDQTFMLQKEVVERMAAQAGNKEYGRLSVMLQWRHDIENLFEVPPEAFDPPPKVDSAIVRMTPRRDPIALDVDLLFELVASAFSQRRKLLRHTLGQWLAA